MDNQLHLISLKMTPAELMLWLREHKQIDPESLDYSRGVQIITDVNGKFHFMPKHNLTEEEQKEIEELKKLPRHTKD